MFTTMNIYNLIYALFLLGGSSNFQKKLIKIIYQNKTYCYK